MTIIISVADRAGVLLRPVEEAADQLATPTFVHSVARPSELGPEHEADILVMGTRELTASGLKRVARWHAAHPFASIVAQLAEGAEADEELLLGHGVTSWFVGAPEADVVLLVLEQELAALSEVALVLDEDADTADAPQPALSIAICSATGGCGKTFLSSNVAYHLGKAGLRVLLVDLDLQFGEVGAALQVRHPYSVYDGLYDAKGRALPADALDMHLHELVHHHPLGFDVLLAPRDPALSDFITASDVDRALEVAAFQYDVVVVDTPPAITDIVLTAIDRSDVVAVVTCLDVPSLRNLQSFLDILDRLEVEPDRVRLLLNKVESDIGIDVKQAQEAFDGRFLVDIPADKSASRSINNGSVVLETDPRTPIARAVVRAVEAIVPEEVLPRSAGSREADAGRSRRSLRDLVLSRRPARGGTP